MLAAHTAAQAAFKQAREVWEKNPKSDRVDQLASVGMKETGKFMELVLSTHDPDGMSAGLKLFQTAIEFLSLRIMGK
jgi:hypothetical protein